MAEPLPADGGRTGIGRRIALASAVILLAHAILKVIGLIQARFVGQFCDDFTRDLYIFSFETILGTLVLIGEDAIGPALLPVFLAEKEEKGEEKAWRFAGTALVFHALLVIAAGAVVFVFPLEIVHAVTKWDEDPTKAAYLAAAPLWAQHMVLALLGVSLSASTYRLLNAYKRFFLAALGDAAVKVGVVGALAAAWALGCRIEGATAATVFFAGAFAGGALKLLLHGWGLKTEMRFLRLRPLFADPAFRRFLWLFLPLLVGILFAKVRDEYNQRYLTSGLEDGLMALNAWGRRIYQTLGTTVPYAVGLAMLPFFCEMMDRKQERELGDLVTKSTRALFVVFAAVAAIIAAIALPLTRLLYQAGKFTLGDCEIAAVSCFCYTLVLPFYTVEYVLMQAFFSGRRMVAVTGIGIAFSSLSMLLSWTAITALGFRGADALAGVALAFTVSRIGKTICLAIVLKRFVPCLPAGATLRFLAVSAAVAGATGGAAYAARLGVERFLEAACAGAGWRLPENGTETTTLEVMFRVGPPLAVAALVAAIVAVLLGRWLCPGEWGLAAGWVREKIRRRRARTAGGV